MDILRALIKKEALVEVEYNYSRPALVLEEADSEPPYNIKVIGIPNDTIAFKADIFPSPKAIFKGDKGECKRADFILITRTSKANWIVYIEMKRGGSRSAKEITQQLKGAKCLLDYCRAIGRTFWRKPIFLEEKDYQQRFVSIKNVSMNKRPTRMPPQSGLHDSPEKMLKIKSPGEKMQFRELINF